MWNLYLTTGLIMTVVDHVSVLIEMAIWEECRRLVWNSPYKALLMSWSAVLLWPVKIVTAVIIIGKGGVETYADFCLSGLK